MSATPRSDEPEPARVDYPDDAIVWLGVGAWAYVTYKLNPQEQQRVKERKARPFGFVAPCKNDKEQP